MGTRRGNSLFNVLIGRLSKVPMKVKIALGALLAVCALVALKFTVKDMRYFFIASETFHLAGTIILLYKLFTLKNCSGVSLKTQELIALFLAARLSCSTIMEGNIHTLLDMISLLSVSLIVWMIRFKLKSSYVKELDNFRLLFVVVPCAVLALLIHPYTIHFRLTRILWAFSVYLEAVAVLPQIRFMQNAKMVETLTGKYVFALGVSRFIGFAHWIIQIYETRGAYFYLVGHGHFWFLVAFIAEMIQSFILADFCYYYMKSFMQGQLLRKMPV
ncbi:hypothetical protein RIF29_00671 [Crotalaria pallida]|uniref:ER lumen protein retaining receptor n=1 Tax=Crotalaria pallida TaxID=3830 RepID=A0AAN9IWX4_CROPI